MATKKTVTNTSRKLQTESVQIALEHSLRNADGILQTSSYHMELSLKLRGTLQPVIELHSLKLGNLTLPLTYDLCSWLILKLAEYRELAAPTGALRTTLPIR